MPGISTCQEIVPLEKCRDSMRSVQHPDSFSRLFLHHSGSGNVQGTIAPAPEDLGPRSPLTLRFRHAVLYRFCDLPYSTGFDGFEEFVPQFFVFFNDLFPVFHPFFVFPKERLKIFSIGDFAKGKTVNESI